MMPTFAVEPRAAERTDHFKSKSCDLVRVEGVTNVDPQILLRVLQLVLVHGGTPVVVNSRHRRASNRFSLQIAGLPGSERLVARLGAIVGVRAVRGRVGRSERPASHMSPAILCARHHD
jgi:hypothetical protein